MKAAVAYGDVFADFDLGVFGVELAVRLFIRLLNALYALDNILRLDILNIDLRCVADKTENRGVNAVPTVDFNVIVGFQLFGKGQKLFRCCGRF